MRRSLFPVYLLMFCAVLLVGFSYHRLLVEYYVFPVVEAIDRLDEDAIGEADLTWVTSRLEAASALQKNWRELYGLQAAILEQTQQRKLAGAEGEGEGSLFSGGEAFAGELFEQRSAKLLDGLRVAPSDARVWISLAEARGGADYLDQLGQVYLRMSHILSPADADLSRRRIALGLTNLPYLSDELKQVLRRDIQQEWKVGKIGTRSISLNYYFTSNDGVQSFIRGAIGQMDDESIAEFEQAIARPNLDWEER